MSRENTTEEPPGQQRAWATCKCIGIIILQIQTRHSGCSSRYAWTANLKSSRSSRQSHDLCAGGRLSGLSHAAPAWTGPASLY